MMRMIKRKAGGMTEAAVTAQIRGMLNTLGIFHWKVYQTLGCMPGVSDIIACYNGRLVAIEVKRPNGRPTAQQQRFLDMINRSGGLGIVARSADGVIRALGLQSRFSWTGE